MAPPAWHSHTAQTGKRLLLKEGHIHLYKVFKVNGDHEHMGVLKHQESGPEDARIRQRCNPSPGSHEEKDI